MGWRIWIIALGLIPCWACGSEPPEEQVSAITTHYAKDGTQFITAAGNTQALPDHFPEHLLFPEATLLSSGHIWNRAGGVASLLLRTTVAEAELLDHYRQGLWFHHWDLLSEGIQDNSRLLTFEYTHPEARRYQQVVIQIAASATQPQTHEVLVLLSYETPAGIWTDYPQKSLPSPFPDSETPALAEISRDVLSESMW